MTRSRIVAAALFTVVVLTTALVPRPADACGSAGECCGAPADTGNRPAPCCEVRPAPRRERAIVGHQEAPAPPALAAVLLASQPLPLPPATPHEAAPRPTARGVPLFVLFLSLLN